MEIILQSYKSENGKKAHTSSFHIQLSCDQCAMTTLVTDEMHSIELQFQVVKMESLLIACRINLFLKPIPSHFFFFLEVCKDLSCMVECRWENNLTCEFIKFSSDYMYI